MEIQIIRDACIGCLFCVRDCVAGVWRETGGAPEAAFPERCSMCSHCLAVCPTGAVRHTGLDPLQVRPIDKQMVRPDVYETIVRARRSVRQFRNRAVPEDLIQKLIHLAAHSPTASNSQNVGYLVITKPDLLKEVSHRLFGLGSSIFRFSQTFPGKFFFKFIRAVSKTEVFDRYLDPMPYYLNETAKGRDMILHNAPVLILIHGPRKKRFSCENCNIAAANIMNYACSLGLGTCYIGFLTLYLKYGRKLRNRFLIPENRTAYAALVIGWPAYGHVRTASRTIPKIKWLR